MTLMQRHRALMIGNSTTKADILGSFSTIRNLQLDVATAAIKDGKLIVDLSGKDVSCSEMILGGNVPVDNLEITIKCKTIKQTGGGIFAFAGKTVKSITFDCDQEYFNVISRFTGGSGGAGNCLEFYGLPLYVATAPSGNYGPFGRANFRHADFVENVTTGVFYLGGCSLLDDSTCISAANALNAGSPNTITFHSTPKARLASIMGYVESVTSDEETYYRFVQDVGGDISLQDFITATKGWTLG